MHKTNYHLQILNGLILPDHNAHDARDMIVHVVSGFMNVDVWRGSDNLN